MNPLFSNTGLLSLCPSDSYIPSQVSFQPDAAPMHSTFLLPDPNSVYYPCHSSIGLQSSCIMNTRNRSDETLIPSARPAWVPLTQLFTLMNTTSTAAYLCPVNYHPNYIWYRHRLNNMNRTHAAVVPYTSTLLARVKSAIDAANRSVKTPTMPSLTPIGLTKYNAMIAPTRRDAEHSMLSTTTIELTRCTG